MNPSPTRIGEGVGILERDEKMMSTVRIDHPTDRPNFSVVEIGNLTLWFSYHTPISFSTQYGRNVVRENEWGPTTGKHMGMIAHKREDRVKGPEFERLLAEATSRVLA